MEVQALLISSQQIEILSERLQHARCGAFAIMYVYEISIPHRLAVHRSEIPFIVGLMLSIFYLSEIWDASS